MAENKKSFVLYTDLIHTVRKMKDVQAGQLLKTILAYVNDENPEVGNPIVDLVFEPIKRQMKRDLEKWEDKIDKRSDAGMKSAGKKSFEKWLQEALSKGIDKLSPDDHLFEAGRCTKYMTENYGTYMFYHFEFAKEWHQQMATNSTLVDFVEQNSTNSTVNDTVTVTVNVNDTSSFKKEAKYANLENQESGTEDLKTEQPKRKKVPRKKEKDEPPEIPTMQAFTAYGKQKAPDVSEHALELKYTAWVESGWRNGHGKLIINWKSSLLNTIPYLPKNINSTNGHQQTTNADTGNSKPKTIGGMRATEVEEFVRRQRERNFANNGNDESGSS